MTTYRESHAVGIHIDRRAMLIAAAIVASPVYVLVREARAERPTSDGRLSASRWIDRQEELAQALYAGSISHVAWHDEVNRLAAQVDVDQLLSEAMRESTQVGVPFMRDPVKRSVHFIGDDGRPRRLTYAAATFTFGPENVITPHAHEHMVSAHMIVSGKVRIRTFDRVLTHEDAIVIRPTEDRIGSIGDAAAMTTEKDNIHWFTPATARATTIDVIVDSLDKGEKDYVIQPIDPLGGTLLADGTIRAPLLSFEESMRRYSANL